MSDVPCQRATTPASRIATDQPLDDPIRRQQQREWATNRWQRPYVLESGARVRPGGIGSLWHYIIARACSVS